MCRESVVAGRLQALRRRYRVNFVDMSISGGISRWRRKSAEKSSSPRSRSSFHALHFSLDRALIILYFTLLENERGGQRSSCIRSYSSGVSMGDLW